MECRTRLDLALALTGLVAGCVPGVEPGFGSESGGDVASPQPDNPPRPACEGAITELSPDQPTSLGLSATEATRRVAGKFQGTLSWTAGAAQAFADAPAAHDTAITIEVTPTGAVRLVDERKTSATPGERLACGPPRLELGATVRISTEDGSFAGSWALTIRIESRASVGFSAAIAPADLVGAFKAKPRDAMGFAFKLKVDGNFTDAGKLSGIIGFSAARMTGSQGEGFAGPIATFEATSV